MSQVPIVILSYNLEKDKNKAFFTLRYYGSSFIHVCHDNCVEIFCKVFKCPTSWSTHYHIHVINNFKFILVILC